MDGVVINVKRYLKMLLVFIAQFVILIYVLNV